MKNASQYRASASLCRQAAAYSPDKRWELLAQAERWEHLAAMELASHFQECNADRSVCSTDSGAALNVDGSRWKTIAGDFFAGVRKKVNSLAASIARKTGRAKV
jgi:hypothetical protein